MEVFAFIDTNVLLHYRFFRDVDWVAALDEPEVVLVLAPVVLDMDSTEIPVYGEQENSAYNGPL